MNVTKSKLSAVLSLIPERTARSHTGTAFVMPDATACRYPERVARLASCLHWLSPLNPITKDDQIALGILTASGRPVSAKMAEEDAEGDLADADGELDAIESLADETGFEDFRRLDAPAADNPAI